MNKNEQEWLPLTGFEDFYKISKKGIIKSIDRTIIDKNGFTRKIKGKILVPGSKNDDGIKTRKIWKNGNAYYVNIKNEVAKLFKGKTGYKNNVTPADFFYKKQEYNRLDNGLVTLAKGFYNGNYYNEVFKNYLSAIELEKIYDDNNKINSIYDNNYIVVYSNIKYNEKLFNEKRIYMIDWICNYLDNIKEPITIKELQSVVYKELNKLKYK